MVRRTQSIVEFYSLDSPFANEFRRLLLKIRNSGRDVEIKTLLMTSAMLSEGKSTICSLLGVTAAGQDGLKTLIIDCDLRRPTIHKLFALDRSPGLSDILVEGYKAKEAIQKTSVHKLDILTSGTPSEHPAEVFDSEAIGFLLDELKFYYDLILVDTAPILPVSDPLLLSSKTDRVLLVVKAGQTTREVTERAMQILSANRDKILGVVLNNLSNALPYYHDYQYYGYDYRPTSDKDGKMTKRRYRSRKARRDQEQSNSVSTRKSK